MGAGDDGEDGEALEESAEALPEAPMKRPTVQEWLVIFGAPLAICSLLALVFPSSLYVLFAGRSATLTAVWNCVRGTGVTAPEPTCHGTWQFADGSVGTGTVHSTSAGTGDTVVAAGGWAYSSLGSVWQSAWFFLFLAAVSVVTNAITWVSHFRQDQRERTRKLREPFEYVPGYRAFDDPDD